MITFNLLVNIGNIDNVIRATSSRNLTYGLPVHSGLVNYCYLPSFADSIQLRFLSSQKATPAKMKYITSAETDIVITLAPKGGPNMLFALMISIRTTNIIMPYLPTNVVPFVDFKYIPSHTNNNIVSSKYVATALFHKPNPILVELSLNSGKSGVWTIKSKNQ